MVELVDRLVERAPVQGAMSPIMPGILKDKEYQDLHCHFRKRRKRHASIHSKIVRHGMEEPYLRKFNSEVDYKNEPCASPLL